MCLSVGSITFPAEIVFMLLDHLRPYAGTLQNLYLVSRDVRALLLGWLEKGEDYLEKCLWYGFVEALDRHFVNYVRAIYRAECGILRTASPRTVILVGFQAFTLSGLMDAFGIPALRWYARNHPLGREAISPCMRFMLDPPGTPITSWVSLQEALKWNCRVLEVAEHCRLRGEWNNCTTTWNPEISDQTYVAIMDRLNVRELFKPAYLSGRMWLTSRFWKEMDANRRMYIMETCPEDRDMLTKLEAYPL